MKPWPSVREWGRTFAVLFLILTVTCPGLAASERSELFQRATEELERGAFNDAIVHFEQLSDLGVVEPNVSFNRGLAYLQRAESTSRRDGDLGQAAAAFREVILLSDGDDEAQQALEKTRNETSRRRAQRGLDPVVIRPALGRAVVTLVPELVWALGALLGSLTFSVGLWLRRSQREEARALTGRILSIAGLFILLVFGGMTWASRSLRVGTREAVVVAQEARLLDDAGRPLKTRALDVETVAIPEGASVVVSEQRGRLLKVSWGSTDAWVNAEGIRLIGWASPSGGLPR